MIPPLVNKLNFKCMTKYCDNLLLVIASDIYDIASHTKFYLSRLSIITKYLPIYATPIPL